MKCMLQCPTRIRRFFELRKIKKDHPDLIVLKKGFSSTGCGYSFYWAEVQYND